MTNLYASIEELVEALDYDKLRNLPLRMDYSSISYDLERLLIDGKIEDLIKTILYECTKYPH